MKLLPWFEKDVEFALRLIELRVPDRAHELNQFRKAKANGSSMLAHRFKVLLDNALAGPERYEFTAEEKLELGEMLLRLEEYFRTGKPGPRLRGNEYRLMVYLTRAENEQLSRYCDQHNMTRAAAVRAGLQALAGSEERSVPG